MIKFEASVEKKDNTVINCYTASMDELMDFLGKYEDDYLWVIDHETGELLFRANHPTAEDYMDEHFLLMCMGWVSRDLFQAPDSKQEIVEAIHEICKEFGATLTILR